MTKREKFKTTFGVVEEVHPFNECIGPCPVHAPTDHPLRKWPLDWDDEQGIFTRICEHFVPHPDPDSVQYAIEYEGREISPHRCDGCCIPRKETK